MKAFRLTAPGATELCDIDPPEPRPGEVVLRVGAASFCHSDIPIVAQPAALSLELPVTLGHEIAGFVHAVGADVAGVEQGEAVAVFIIQGCGTCAACSAGMDNQCRNNVISTPGVHRDGGMAEFVRVDARYVLPLDGVAVEQAAPLTDAGLTSYHAVNHGAGWLRPGACAVVIGIGGLGHLALQTIKATSAAHVIAVDVADDRLDLARKLGADETVRSDDGAVGDVLSRTNGVDAVFDFVGSQDTVDLAASVTRKGGVIVVAGVGDGHVPTIANMASLGAPMGMPIVRSDAHVIRSFAGTRRDLREVLALARAGAIHVETTVYPLDDAASALADFEAGKVLGRAVVVPGA